MPQLIFKGLKEDEVILLSKTLSDDLAKTTDTPNDWFLFEHIERKCYVLGERLTGDIHVDVWWFDRGQEIRDKVALSIDSAIRHFGYSQIEISFNLCHKESYYENGQHY